MTDAIHYLPTAQGGQLRAWPLGQEPEDGLTPEQKARRAAKLTGSTVAEALGYSPYRSPEEFCAVCLGLRTVEETADMRFGKWIEQPIGRATRHEFLERFGPDAAEVVKPDTIVHPVHGAWWIAHPDYLFPGLRKGIQIKNHAPQVQCQYKGRPGSTGDADNDLIPKHELFQCLWEMEATRARLGRKWDEWWLAPYFGGSNLQFYRIVPDARLLRLLAAEAHRVWREHISPDGPRRPLGNEHWQYASGTAAAAPTAPVQRLTGADLQAAPIPFLDDAAPTVASWAPEIPFGRNP